jgi:hypothetical protein
MPTVRRAEPVTPQFTIHPPQRVNAGLEFLKIAGLEFPSSDVRLNDLS